jgi:hypothetical protein
MSLRHLGPLLALAAAAQTGRPPGADLDEVARIATVMIDGDVCRRIPTPRSREFLFKKDPRDPWVGSDNHDVDHAAFIQTKKTLMRLARLCRRPCDVNLWMPVMADPPRVQILIRNVNELSQFWSFGVMYQDTPPQMLEVLKTGKRVRVEGVRPGLVSVLAPVEDSLGDVAGLVEVVGRR